MDKGWVLFNDDCLNVLPSIDDGSVDLILTDVPYWVNYSNWKKYDDSKEYVFNYYILWLREMYRALKENHHCYIFIPTLEADRRIWWVKEVGFRLYNILSTRTYTNSTYLKNNFKFDNQMIIYCSKWKAKPLNKVDRIPTSDSWLRDKRNKNPKPFTYQYPSFLNMFSNRKANAKSKNIHWNEKSIEFCSRLIELSSDIWDTVLDPFMWSWTTIASAIKLNRKYIGIEKEKTYFDMAKQTLTE